ncbi:MAG: epoxide hydrolase [Pseudomonadota bacterium]
MAELKPFSVAVDDALLDDLKQRLGGVRWPGEPSDAGWQYGSNLAYMKQLVEYWRDEFNWRQQEAAINRFQHFITPISDEDDELIDIHFIREEGSGDNPMPLLLLHGWPGSIAEFLDVIEPLAHPERFGGDVADAFTVIAPSLPGYGFSSAPSRPIGTKAMAGICSRLMTDALGFDRYVAQGGDWGSIIATRIGVNFPDRLKAIHLNMAPIRPYIGPDDQPISSEEENWIKAARKLRTQETAYQDIHATKSQTLAYGLTDSPVALAAWITEKFHGWTDPSAGAPLFTFDQLLTNIMIYWVTGSINTSMWLYRGLRDERGAALSEGEHVTQPLGFCLPPNDLVPPPPASWLKRIGNVQSVTMLDDGGHFTALQKGPELVEDMRCFFREHAR